MEQYYALRIACDDALIYPKNLPCQRAHPHRYDNYHKHLEGKDELLFHPPKTESVALEFWEIPDQDHDQGSLALSRSVEIWALIALIVGFRRATVRTLEALGCHLNITTSTIRKDPKCRFLYDLALCFNC